MNLRFFASTALFFNLALAFAGDILLTVDNKPVTKDEFIRIYSKNNTDSVHSAQSVDDYLQLFINFRLKVTEAENLGMDTIATFIEELSGYRSQLAQPYLKDTTHYMRLAKEALERSKQEVKVSHIMIRLDADAAPSDTLKAYNKLIEARKRIISGTSFETVAKEVSEDPGAKDNGGNQGYFSSMRFPYPFESAAYNTKVGAVSMPFRTAYGMHIIKVFDKRSSLGQVQVAHIMVAQPVDLSEDSVKARELKIQKIYSELKGGADFANLAKLYSDDRNSAVEGGKLMWFSSGVMVPEFEQAAFALKNIGDISQPIKTSFGWHILKLIDKKGVDVSEEALVSMEKRIRFDDRGLAVYDKYYDRVKEQASFKSYPENLSFIIATFDSSIYTANYNSALSQKLSQTLMEIGGITYTLSDFGSFLAASKRPLRRLSFEAYAYTNYLKFIDEKVKEFAIAQLENQYSDFKNIMQEYHDGILLFDLTDKLVWSKASQDTAGLEAFFAQNRKHYQWAERIDGLIFVCDSTVAQNAWKYVKKNAKKTISIADYKKELCDSIQPNCLKIEEGKFEKSDKEILAQIVWKPGVSPIVDMDGKLCFVLIKKVLPTGDKELNETRGLVIADYQNHLEKQWIEDLRAKYQVKVDSTVLDQIKAELISLKQ